MACLLEILEYFVHESFFPFLGKCVFYLYFYAFIICLFTFYYLLVISWVLGVLAPLNFFGGQTIF